ncbi:DUF4012 domain-containing protein [Humibacter sp.]|uniref:DUF4012 domain-containing protein n=1 Tax=Humibacter sp. TaxID=1940291 RepID=UPI003F7FF947
MSDDEPLTRRSIHRKRRRPLLRSARLWVPVGCVVVLLGLGVLALRVGSHALAAKSDLQAAFPLASQAERQMLAGDNAGAALSAQQVSEKTAAARNETSGPLWHSLEWIPVVGHNLAAVRTLADTTDSLARNALAPAAQINLDAFKPVDGRINTQAIRSLVGTVGRAKESVDSAHADVSRIDRSGLVGPVNSAVSSLDTQLVKAQSVVDTLDPIVRILPGALGADGPRHYLMLFQGNSEVRALGGNPAAMALLSVSDGHIEITKQASSSNFQNARSTSVAPLPAEVAKIYSPIVGEWIPNITSTPDFPLTVQLATAYWAEFDGTHLDGVISFDPVALSYLLAATGPVSLETGQTLTAQNAVPLLLNQVYSIYPKPDDQNIFFAEAAASVFSVLTSGKGSPAAMFAALERATKEGRLLLWSSDPNEEKIFAASRIGGVLPTSNAKQTVIGSYFNDVTGSKMDYFVKAKVAGTSNQCTSKAPTFNQTVTLSNIVTPAQVPSLPAYVTGPYYTPGDIGTDVVVYGPVGSTLSSWKADGVPAEARAQGEIGGRPVLRLWVGLSPQQSVTLSYTFKGASGTYGPLEEQTTPMVWDTPATVRMPGCSTTKK